MQNAVMEDQGEQDHRKKTGMEDSTSMTIEFLRARLISERSVSRTAKQRADDLAKRVAELEEQLKKATLQKKKAQKTAAEVLVVLEKNGISECSVAFDLCSESSDHEQVNHEDREDRKSNQEEEGSITSRRVNEMEGLSDSEVEGSAVPGRSLSWKGCSDNPTTVEKKYVDQVRRRQSSLVSTSGSSTRPRLGKSCRQIKRRETGSAVDEVEHGALQVDTQENGVATEAGDTFTESGDKASRFENRPKISEEGSENGEGKTLVRSMASESLEDQRKETCDGLDANENKIDAIVESAEENQTQLIGWYETEGNAQAFGAPCVNDNEGNTDIAMESQTRLIGWYETEEAIQKEWEHQARESGSCTPDSSEHGNRSDITEERDETRGAADPAYNMSSHGQRAKFSGDSMAIVPSSGPATSCSVGYSRDQQFNNTPVNKSVTGIPESFFPDKENPGSAVNVKQKKECLRNTSCGFPDYQSEQKSSSFQANGRQEGESSGNLQVAMQYETSNGLGNVLEALQRAKISLKHELSGLPLSNQTRSLVRVPGTPLPTMKLGSATEIPLGCAGLFRVPTDLQLEASSTPQSSFLAPCSDSRLSLTKYYPDIGIGVSPYTGYPGSPNLEIGSRNCTRKPYADLYLDTGMPPPSSTRYACPSHADLKPRMSPEDIFPRHYPNIGAEMLSRDRYSVHNHPVRSNIYNR